MYDKYENSMCWLLKLTYVVSIKSAKFRVLNGGLNGI